MNTGKDNTNNYSNEIDEIKLIKEQIVKTNIELSRVQKEIYEEIRKTAKKGSEGAELSNRKFVLEIAAGELQQQLRNLRSTKALLERSRDEE